MSTNQDHLNQFFVVILSKAAGADWLSANRKCFSCMVKIVPNFGKNRILQLYGEDSFLISANSKYFRCMSRIVS